MRRWPWSSGIRNRPENDPSPLSWRAGTSRPGRCGSPGRAGSPRAGRPGRRRSARTSVARPAGAARRPVGRPDRVPGTGGLGHQPLLRRGDLRRGGLGRCLLGGVDDHPDLLDPQPPGRERLPSRAYRLLQQPREPQPAGRLLPGACRSTAPPTHRSRSPRSRSATRRRSASADNASRSAAARDSTRARSDDHPTERVVAEHVRPSAGRPAPAAPPPAPTRSTRLGSVASCDGSASTAVVIHVWYRTPVRIVKNIRTPVEEGADRAGQTRQRPTPTPRRHRRRRYRRPLTCGRWRPCGPYVAETGCPSPNSRRACGGFNRASPS